MNVDFSNITEDDVVHFLNNYISAMWQHLEFAEKNGSPMGKRNWAFPIFIDTVDHILLFADAFGVRDKIRTQHMLEERERIRQLKEEMDAANAQ